MTVSEGSFEWFGYGPVYRLPASVASSRATGPLPGELGFDPATEAFEPDAVIPDPALGTEVEVTRVEIERTRAGMSETVDAIQERISPENFIEQAKDRVKEAIVCLRSCYAVATAGRGRSLRPKVRRGHPRRAE